MKFLSKLIKGLLPPPGWQTRAVIVLGTIVGLGVFTLHLGKATSYLSDDPKTCVNCHIMTPQYKTWENSSHANVATCNDCHVPQDNFVKKYYFKAMDGLRHSTIFTLKGERQVIQIEEEGQHVVHQNCIRCHSHQLMNEKQSAQIENYDHNRTDRQCWECHRETPHGRVNGLSTVPYGKVYDAENPVPEWLQEAVKKEKNK